LSFELVRFDKQGNYLILLDSMMVANDIGAVTGGAADGANANLQMQIPTDKLSVIGNITKAARSLLRAHFMSVNWQLNKLLLGGPAQEFPPVFFWKNSPITSPHGLSIFICRYQKL
jgi:hypothetical protein